MPTFMHRSTHALPFGSGRALAWALKFSCVLLLGWVLACGGSSSPSVVSPASSGGSPAVAPTLTANPQGQTVVANAAITFAVTATGTDPLHYAWRKDGVPVGTDAPSYTINSAQPAHAGAYTVTVSNSAGSVTSQAATLTVQYITLVAQPPPQTAPEGGQATFQVSATGIPAVLTYQWQRFVNGAWIDLQGATGAAFTTSGILAQDNGASFRCRVSNDAVTVDSDPAALQVNWLRVDTQPSAQSAMAGAAASFTAAASGFPASLTYQWERNQGSGWSDITGATNGTYRFTATLSDAGAQFRCRISNGPLSVVSQPAALAAGLGLTVTITGLPAGLDAHVTVSGPGGYNQTVKATGTLLVPTAGAYTLAASMVEDPGLPPMGDILSPTAHLARHPWCPAQTVQVSAAGATAEVLYPLPAFTVKVPDAANPGSTVPMDFVLVPAGSFLMGETRSASDPHYRSEATPAHRVGFAKAFYLAKVPCTQEQWRAAMNTNPSRFTTANGYPDPQELKRPVDSVNWNDLRTPDSGFLDVLNGLLPGYGFRLPSEAEYEYALRGGTTTDFFFGTYPSSAVNNSYYLDRGGDEFSWATSFVPGVPNHPVGTRRPNPWGLYDLMGNLSEWCEDDYHAHYTGAPADGSAWVDSPSRGSDRVTKGAGNRLEDMASCARGYASPADRSWPQFGVDGFRLAVAVPMLTNPAGPSLSISLPGLLNRDPSGGEVTTAGDVTITGPGGYSQHLTAGATLTGLAEGTYTLSAARVEDTSKPGLGLANGGPLGTLHLARYPSHSTTTVSVGASSGTVQLPVVHPVPAFTHRCKGWLDMPMVFIPAGSFIMGSPDTEPGRSAIEGPQHAVTFEHPFYMARTEVTRNLWSGLMDTPFPAAQDQDKPAGQMSWNDIPAFLVNLNAATEGQRLPGMAYRLPTEAEWEYAARAGSTQACFWGSYPIDLFAWYSGNAGASAHPAAAKAPNAWGLYDMSGNAWEWCRDWFGAYRAEAGTDPVGPDYGSGRVLRGGGFAYDPPNLRSAARAFLDPDSSYDNVGFRVVLVSGAPVITAAPLSQTVTEGDTVTFTVGAMGEGPLHYQWKWNGNPFGSDAPTLTLPAIDLSYTGTITVAVSNALASTTSSAAFLIVNQAPIQSSPVVTTPPAPQSVQEGDSATFSVVATGTAPMHYQWQKDGVNLGSDSDQLVIASAQFSDAGQYRVTVTNPVGNWTTGAVALTVTPAVVITTQPASQMVALGESFTLVTAATGAATLHYQWRKDGVPVGSDSSQLTIASAQLADSGSYTVTVANTKGSATSSAASVTVTTDPVAPVITTHPVSQSVAAGFGATFTVVASGTRPLHYQWKQGTANVGTDSAQFSIASVQPSDAGSYTVTVSNSGGSAISNPADLAVAGSPSFTLPGGVALALTSIPAGTFTMGSAPAEHGSSYPNEGPAHQVTLSTFYMGTYEVTQAQWMAVMGSNPSYFQLGNTAWIPESGSRSEDLTRPVEQVSYFDITTPQTGFLDKLNALTAGTRPAGLVFRLPTEAEWEYACRAGTTTAYYWGDDGYSTQSWSQYVGYAWWPANGGGVTHGTGDLKTANAFGLFNMSGNAWEWCQDWYDAAYYAASPASNPAGPASGTERVLRGGDAILLAKFVARSAMRMKWTPDTAYQILGLRVVLALPNNP